MIKTRKGKESKRKGKKGKERKIDDL